MLEIGSPKMQIGHPSDPATEKLFGLSHVMGGHVVVGIVGSTVVSIVVSKVVTAEDKTKQFLHC